NQSNCDFGNREVPCNNPCATGSSNRSGAVSGRDARLMEKVESRFLAGPQLQAVRVTTLLEGMDTPEARGLLEDLAKGEPAARLTCEAKTSLERLAQRAAAVP